MQTPLLMENIQEIPETVQSRITQLEETILELYQSFCPIYGTIDFAQVSPEDFDTPYSTHSVPIPHTKLSVNMITTPPHLVIGTPASHTPGPLHWEHKLKIEFPAHTAFVSFRYGGEAGDVQWFSADGAGHPLPALPALVMPDQTGHFYFAQHEGIRSIQITGTGKMFLTTLAVGISARA